MKFDWDAAKETANIAKHGVTFSEATKAFSDPKAVSVFDTEHSTKTELRWWLLGRIGHRVMLVRYTHRPSGVIRIFGAGYWKIGKEIYEKANQA